MSNPKDNTNRIIFTLLFLIVLLLAAALAFGFEAGAL
jgi:hypothetical protein